MRPSRLDDLKLFFYIWFMDDEIWKVADAPYEKYEVSNLGRVRGIRRGVILKPCQKTLEVVGRVALSLWQSDGTRCTQNVARLVAKAFVPGDWSLTADFKDGDRTNAVASNLFWSPAKPVLLARSVIKLDPVTREPLERYPSCAEACRSLGKSADESSAITKAIRRGWRYSGFFWAYAT